jgi:signal transduction histidine kinase
MREWVEMVGGGLTVETAPGRGSTIYMEVPCGDTDSHRG